MISSDVAVLAVCLGGAAGLLAIMGLIVEAIERRREQRAAQFAADQAEEAYYRASLETASQVGVKWPPVRRSS